MRAGVAQAFSDPGHCFWILDGLLRVTETVSWRGRCSRQRPAQTPQTPSALVPDLTSVACI